MHTHTHTHGWCILSPSCLIIDILQTWFVLLWLQLQLGLYCWKDLVYYISLAAYSTHIFSKYAKITIPRALTNEYSILAKMEIKWLFSNRADWMRSKECFKAKVWIMWWVTQLIISLRTCYSFVIIPNSYSCHVILLLVPHADTSHSI